MIKAPYQDRIEFWKFQNAAITFSETRQLCDLILKDKIVSGHPLHASLMTALHILYGRPFKQRAEVRLPEEIVPPEFTETHSALLNMRDKIYAHTDADGPKTASDETLNKVAVHIQGRAARFAITMLFPRDIQKIHDLTEKLAEKTWYHAEKIWRKHFKDSFIKDGSYEINISKTDDSFLKNLQW